MLRDVVRNGYKLLFLQPFRHTDNFIGPAFPDNAIQFRQRITADHSGPLFRFLIRMIDAPHCIPGRQIPIILNFRIINYKSLIKGNQFKGCQMFRTRQERFKKRLPYPAQFVGKQRLRFRGHIDHSQHVLSQIRILLCPLNCFPAIYWERHNGIFCRNNGAHFIFQLL